MFWLQALALLATIAVASGCTIARSEVKTLRDRGATHIRMDTLIHTSITALNDLPAKCGPTWDRRVREEEFNVYQVIGTIRGVKRAPDHDIHIILADPQNSDARVIVELPAPDSRGSVKSPHRDKFVLAKQMFEDLVAERGARRFNDLRGVPVRVTGIGFFDLSHFQVGRSRSCIELHPVLAIESVRDALVPPIPKTWPDESP